MLWQIMHRWFGWDYVYWQNCVDQGVARVYVDGTGAPYYWRYRPIKVADVIRSPSDVMWLTCAPEKYCIGKGCRDQDREGM